MRAAILASAAMLLVTATAARAGAADLTPGAERSGSVTVRLVGPAERARAAALERARPAREEEGGHDEANEELENLVHSAVPPGAGTGRSVVEPAHDQAVQAFGYQWSATSFDGPAQVSYKPADPTIAAGPSHVVVAVNTEISIYLKDGTRVYDGTLDAFVGGPVGATWKPYFDPRLGYDEASQRFFFVALTYDLTARSSAMSVAVSTSNDPTLAWNVYTIRTELDGEGLDYPDLGFGPTGVYVCGNYVSFQEWTGSATTNHNASVYAFPKSQLVSGGTLTWWKTTDLFAQDNVYAWCQRPAQQYGPPPPGIDEVLVSSQVRASQPNKLTLNVWGVTLPADFPTHGPSFDRRGIDTDFPGAPLLAPQKGGAVQMQTTIQGANLLHATSRTRAMVVTANLGNGTRTFARAMGVNIGSWPALSIPWQSDMDDGTNFTYFPQACENNSGDVCMTYARSGSGEFVGMHANVRPHDGPGFAGDLLVQGGTQYYNVDVPPPDRWGDYAGAATDPVNQGFWLAHMYASSNVYNLASQWATRIAYIPRAVFVDGSSLAGESGSPTQPWHTIPLGQAYALPGNDLVVRTGTYAAGITLSTPMRVVPDGGVVQIGP